MELKTVTVVIPSYNRPERLDETLRALMNQSFPAKEIIVVDDGSSPENVKKKSVLCARYSPACRMLEQKNAGASAALNNGIRHATGDLILIIDDDIILDSDTVARHVEFQNAQGPCLLSGDARTDGARVSTDVEQYKVFMEEEWLRKRPETSDRVKVDYNNFIVTTANTSFTREIFDRIGGFDEQLRDGYDVDFAIGALINNVPVWFDRSIRSVHNDRITLRYYAQRQSLYNRSKQMILAKRPELRDRLKIAPSSGDSGIRKLIYPMLRKDNIVNFIERSRLMLLLPRKLRYRIYGSTIAALCGRI